jgi:ribosomal 50S subunit-associated protein YjgA (DUF615 family)
MLDLDEWERLANAATPGPWEAGTAMCCPDMGWVDGPKGKGRVCPTYEAGKRTHTLDAQDAEFIAMARTAVPALIAEVRRLQADPRMQTPLDGPGSHRADLRALRVTQQEAEAAADVADRQRTRAKEAEAEVLMWRARAHEADENVVASVERAEAAEAEVERLRRASQYGGVRRQLGYKTAALQRAKARNAVLRSDLATARAQLGRLGARLHRVREDRKRLAISLDAALDKLAEKSASADSAHGETDAYADALLDANDRADDAKTWAARWKRAAKAFWHRWNASTLAETMRADRIQWRLDRTREVLREVQWSARIGSHPYALCPMCRNFDTQDHVDGCRLAEALRDE